MQVVSQDNVQAICNAFVDCQSQPSCGLRQLPSLRTWNCKSKQQSLVGKGNSRSFPKNAKKYNDIHRYTHTPRSVHIGDAVFHFMEQNIVEAQANL